MKPVYLLAASSVATAQQLYIPAQGTSPRPQCVANSSYATATPVYSFRDFSFTQTETVRTATSRPIPTTTTSFAPPYASLSSLVPSLTTTQWGNWDPALNLTATDTGVPYGNASWTALWTTVSWTNFTRGIYSTTVEPTAVPTSELVLPPPEYLAPRECYTFPKDFMLGVVRTQLLVLS
jgi:hypothetical protein